MAPKNQRQDSVDDMKGSGSQVQSQVQNEVIQNTSPNRERSARGFMSVNDLAEKGEKNVGEREPSHHEQGKL
jgi:hypothetical protein